jgi:Cilia- and flagella-associated protein 298
MSLIFGSGRRLQQSLLANIALHLHMCASCAYVQYGTDDLELESASLWFAGKQMLPENKLRVHVGRHEKSKVVIKLQKKGQGAPAREPVRTACFACHPRVSLNSFAVMTCLCTSQLLRTMSIYVGSFCPALPLVIARRRPHRCVYA